MIILVLKVIGGFEGGWSPDGGTPGIGANLGRRCAGWPHLAGRGPDSAEMWDLGCSPGRGPNLQALRSSSTITPQSRSPVFYSSGDRVLTTLHTAHTSVLENISFPSAASDPGQACRLFLLKRPSGPRRLFAVPDHQRPSPHASPPQPSSSLNISKVLRPAQLQGSDGTQDGGRGAGPVQGHPALRAELGPEGRLPTHSALPGPLNPTSLTSVVLLISP